MTLPTIFANLPAGNVAASLLDQNLAVLEAGMLQGANSAGIADVYTLSPLDPWVTGYANYANTGLIVTPNITNTGPATLNVSGLGAINIVKNVSGSATVLTAGDFVAGTPYVLLCDGTQFWVVGGGTSGGADVGSGYRAGYYYAGGFFFGGDTGFAVTANRMYAIPFLVLSTASFDRFVLEPSSASGNVRVGVYRIVDGVPDTLVSDLGTVAVSASNSITISLTLSAGLYALVALFSGTPSMARFAQSAEEVLPNYIGASAPNFSAGGFYVAQAFGALPANFGTPTDELISGLPSMWLRAA